MSKKEWVPSFRQAQLPLWSLCLPVIPLLLRSHFILPRYLLGISGLPVIPSRSYNVEEQLHRVSLIETDPLSISLPKSKVILWIPIMHKIFMEPECEELRFVF